MRAGLDKWWLLPLGVLTASVQVALGLVLFGPFSFGDSSGEGVARPAVANCSGASALDYACYEKRYHDLVLHSGVEAAFADLKDEREKNGFVRASCHELTHVIGRTAVELYGDLAGAYAHGDPLCSSGYYHGATEPIMARIGADKIAEEVDTVCADLRKNQRYSTYHYNCVHGMGHGFMGVFQSELFESLHGCDALKDGWEKEQCYGGVFMENLSAVDNPSRPSKYLRVDQPLYPCTVVEDRYKNECYEHQIAYALYTQNNDYAKVFDLCETTAEEDFRPACYQGLGGSASAHNIKYVTGDEAKAQATRKLCMMGQDEEARSNCLIGAARNFIHYYASDEQAKTLCKSLDTNLRPACFQEAEQHYEEAALD